MSRECGYIIKTVKDKVLGNEASKDGKYTDFECKNIFFENVYLNTQDGVKIGCWILGPKEIDLDTKYLIVLHGNECNRAQFTEKYNIKRLVDFNYVLFIPDYRSFGDSEGDFWIDTVNLDIDAVYDLCISRFRHSPDFIGHSLGCAIVLEFLKFSCHLNKMVLISPFTSTLDIVADNFFWKMIKVVYSNADDELKKYFNYDNMKNIEFAESCNVLIFHGTKDLIIPYDQGKKLADLIDCFFVTLEDYDHEMIFYTGNALFKIDWFLRG